MLKEAALKIYREKRAFLPVGIPEAYYGITQAPEDASMWERVKHFGKTYLGGLGGQAKGALIGSALGGTAGLFNPFRNPNLGGRSRSASMFLDSLLYGLAGMGIGGTIGRMRGARQASMPVQELPENIYDIRGTNV